MSSGLKQTLKNLCCSNGWSYGVFWRFDQRNSMLLTFENAYYEEQMGIVVDDMLLKVHLLGEGIIGQAALTGEHRWLSSDATQHIFQGQHEFHSQFLSGVKTILVVSAGSRGVLQFGSIDKILESLEFLDQTKRLLQQMDSIDHRDAPSSLDSETYDLDGLFASLGPLGYSKNGKSLDPHHGFSFDEIMANPCSSTSSALSSLISESCEPFQTEGIDAQDNEQNFVQEGSYNICSGMEEFKEDDFGMDILSSYSLDDLYQSLAQSPEQSIKTTVIEDHQESLHVYSVSPSLLLEDDVLFESTQMKPSASLAHSDDQQSSSIIQNGDNDLFDAVGLSFGSQKTLEFQEELSALSGISESKSELGKISMACNHRGLFSELGIDELINSFNNNSSSSSNSCLEDHLNPTKRRKLESSSSSSSNVARTSLLCSAGSINLTQQPLSHSWGKMNHSNALFKKEVFPNSQRGLWIDDSYSINVDNANAGPSKKPEETVKATKKRAKPGESTRPKPKDRQMIQDRIKELRGIIPNGMKCSIDALLDLTIKHMLFMQSMAKYADKLKQSYTPKLINLQNGLPLKERVGDGSGATWAFEVGDQTMVCPIIVEDLSPPGQMLIEMLCEERGHFFEIADIIKGLGLNILKSVMETREGKIWTHFIVEAKRHVTRLEVFWSLVQLLQQSDTNSIDPTSQTADAAYPLSDASQQPLSSLPLSLEETLQ